MRTLLLIAVVVVASVPLTTASCYSERVHALARAPAAITAPPYPEVGFEAGTCVSTPTTGQVDDHVFLPKYLHPRVSPSSGSRRQ
ncbi:MAG: hypothetical protein WDA16_01270 [Candidatus Thermoplasmatota archaeon]